MRQHWEEIALNKKLMRLDPDWHRYYMLEEQELLMTHTVWANEQLVGYSLTFVMPHLHYKQLMCAQNDVIFIAKPYRGIGKGLIARVEQDARNKGARLMLWHSKPDTALNGLMPRMGYRVQDIVHSREL
jgi:GNAT superfamily N-acetyltransferase